MSDAMGDQIRWEREDTAKNAYLATVIKYLHNPTVKGRKQRVEKEMQKYAEVLRGRTDDHMEDLRETFEELETNNHPAWKALNRQEEEDLFRKNPISKKLFLEAAQKRNIGKMQWII